MKKIKTKIIDIKSYENGNRKHSYNAWSNMIRRCYDGDESNYEEVEVCDEWMVYSNFDIWFNKNYISGYHLDKDLLIQGNKIYSPDTCVFIPHELNQILGIKRKGNYPTGVRPHQGKFNVLLRKYGKQIYLGTTNSLEEGHELWKSEKYKYMIEVATTLYDNNKISIDVLNAVKKYIL